MPFTFAHPAIVLPLNYLPKRWISLTGLIIGSMVPDFEYFIRMRVKSDYSHTVPGLFWFDLPLGLMLAFVFHNLVRNHLFANLPPFLRRRWQVYQQFNWNSYFSKNWFVVIVSLVTGSASHLFWDAFTHTDGYFVNIFPVLSSRGILLGTEVPILKIMQHTSTFLGLLILAWVIFRMPVHSALKHNGNRKYWLVFGAVTTGILAIRFFVGLSLTEFGNLIVSAIAAVNGAAILTPLFRSGSRGSRSA